MSNILIAIIVLGGIGAFFGVVISVFSKVFAVDEDERLKLILEALPNANCGGCGFAGCPAFAAAIIEGKINAGGCPVGGSDLANKIAEIMGVKVEAEVPYVAKVKCNGRSENATTKYLYDGIEDCVSAASLAGGNKVCTYACLGLGSCKAKCKWDAISIVDNVAKVDEKKCTACGMCTKICPKNVIELVPKRTAAFVNCNSQNKGPIVRQICEVGCIGCGICVKNCPEKVITLENNLAKISRKGCINCGVCIAKCPRNIIITS